MHRQFHFGKVKSSSCSSVDTAAAATLRYAIQRTGKNTDVFTVHSTIILYVEIRDRRMHPNTSVGFSFNWPYYNFYTTL